MPPEERDKLGINKSTLWHMKKNIASKDKIKIYDGSRKEEIMS